jgi:hypothetical protein
MVKNEGRKEHTKCEDRVETGRKIEPRLRSAEEGLMSQFRKEEGVSLFSGVMLKQRRSQWRGGLRHELSSFSHTLGTWVRIPLKTWILVCVYSVFVLVAAL